MWYLRRILIGVAVLLPLVPLLGEADSGNDDLEHNRHLLERLRKDPEHYERLRRNLLAFLAMPEERQERLRRLDRDLHEENSATVVRLQGVLERYADWLQRLPDAERLRIQSETDPKQRLQLIRELREREWVERLPKAVREDLQKLPPEQQRLRMAELKKEERQRRQQWQIAIRNWNVLTQNRPPMTRLENLTPPPVKNFVYDSLLPMLSAQEKNRLLQAQGKYPLFLQTLVELADKHPLKLPGPPGPATFEQLPSEVQTRLTRVKGWPSQAVQQAEGQWPDYALAVVQFARANKVQLPKQLGACRPGEFSPTIRQFIERRLLPVLGADDAALLKKAEGHWPGYPRQLLRLAAKHGLQVPGMRLPGPRQSWDAYRTPATAQAEALPEVPIHTLLEFARTEMAAEEQASLPTLWFNDPANRMKVNAMYLKHHPKVLQKLRQADQKAQQRKQLEKIK